MASALQRFQNDVLPMKDRIFRLALRITLDRMEAEDITQETLIRLWERRDEWHQIQDMASYALTIARRMALDVMKSEERRVKNKSNHIEDESISQEVNRNSYSSLFTLHTPSPLPDELLDQRQRIEAVHRLIATLPEAQRTVFQLRDIEGLRYDEIAQVTGLTETQVRVYLHRARKKIRESL